MDKIGRMVGTNYHPHDWAPERWAVDLDHMRNAGFRMIRIAHLCWDSIEPHDGTFTFEWLDTVMELCREKGIKVFMDIPTRPAPLWLHKKHPSIDIVDAEGNRLGANTRYMEDVGDPHFQKHALRLAETMAKRYGKHPALFAFGLCNELGCGLHSFSPTALERFQKWLEKKYKTVDELNIRWNGKRWSRKVESFSDVFFPAGGKGIKGSPERWLDMKRFFSDEILEYIEKFSECVRQNAPGIPLSANHWAENPEAGYDYHKNYRKVVDYPGEGFYPGVVTEHNDGIINACMLTDYRIGELDAPMWCLEFQVGFGGGYSCQRGVMRMYAYLAWAHRSDIICAWTWRSMLGGEEQYLFGLLDHDGHRGWKYDEFTKIAREWDVLDEKNIRRSENQKRIGLAYSYDSFMVQEYAKGYYQTGYTQQVWEAYKAVFYRNNECNIIDLRDVKKDYPIVIIPGHALLTRECAAAIRAMAENGATVIMTAYSAKADEYNQVFDTPMPGYVNDVFGIAVRGFDRSPATEQRPDTRRPQDIEMDGSALGIAVDYHEFLQPATAEPIAFYTEPGSDSGIAVTCNIYGKGKAVYTGIPANETLLDALISRFDEAGDFTPPPVPRGIVTRKLEDSRRIYINTTSGPLTVRLPYPCDGILGQESYSGSITLAPYGVEII